MQLKSYKFVVVSIVQQIEGDAVVGEQSSEPVAVFGTDELVKWAEGFDDNLAKVNQAGSAS